MKACYVTRNLPHLEGEGNHAKQANTEIEREKINSKSPDCSCFAASW
jgi:hypothetical protein